MTESRYKKGVARPGEIPMDAIWAFRDRQRRCGEHLVWQGSFDDTTPVLVHDYVRYPALRVAWVLHHGTSPVGIVQSECDMPGCVAGPCLTDQVTRQASQKLMAMLYGRTLTGICHRGHPRSEHGTVRHNGKIDCRTCDNDRRRAHRAEKQAVTA